MDSEKLAWNMRRHAINMVHETHASHIGSVLSVVDIVAVLYSDVLNVNPKLPKMAERDRLVLSKGHAGIAIYTALAECGFFPKEELKKYYSDGSVYSGHISSKGVPGVELSTGSLGHGVCVACGMALAAKKDKKGHHIYAIIGDGECNEGSVWEMALFAHQYKLSNFTVVVDHNKMQAMGYCEDIIALDKFGDKWRAFGWNVVEVDDGNNHQQLKSAFIKKSSNLPNLIIANTIKGKGISFMENELLWHYRDPQGDYYIQAINELEASRP